jgi:hypothetical protein
MKRVMESTVTARPEANGGHPLRRAADNTLAVEDDHP